jgi:hypothetical protein
MKLRLLLILGLVINLPLLVSAQKYFEGEITIKVGKPDKSNDLSIIKAYMSPARIRIEGGDKSVDLDMFGANNVSNLLIRLDNEDFVIHTEDMGNTALRITKLDIENMMNMVKNMQRQFAQNGQTPEPEPQETPVSVKKTSDTKTISGLTAQKMIVRSADSPNEEIHVWITDDLNVNLGMLTGDWEFLGSLADSQKWLSPGQFPLLIQEYKNGKIENQAEVTNIKKTKIDADKLDLPNSVQLMSFQDMLMKKMMGQ